MAFLNGALKPLLVKDICHFLCRFPSVCVEREHDRRKRERDMCLKVKWTIQSEKKKHGWDKKRIWNTVVGNRVHSRCLTADKLFHPLVTSCKVNYYLLLPFRIKPLFSITNTAKYVESSSGKIIVIMFESVWEPLLASRYFLLSIHIITYTFTRQFVQQSTG